MSTGSDLQTELRRAGFRGELRIECPLAPHTTWRIGGPAELLALPVDREDLALAAAWAAACGLPWRVLGRGSNLLVRDEGVRGLVLHLHRTLDERVEDPPQITAGAGASLPALARRTAALGLSGLEFGAGIPGTLGGAIVMNAGWHEHEIGNAVAEVEILGPTGALQTLSAAECAFGYRQSRFRKPPGGGPDPGPQRAIVLGARLALTPSQREPIESRLEHFAAVRRAGQPTELPSCGSVFLKPPGDFAGRLIEQAGLKGLRIGGIQVSPKHANFFVNLGSATAADALALVEHVEREVQARFGVQLVREFELW